MVKWSDENENRLLMAIIHVMGASAPAVDWNTVAGLMGPGYTSGGISQKFTKDLKKRAAAQFGDGNGESNKTPVKRSAGKKAAGEVGTKSAGSKRKAQKETAMENDGGDDNDTEETPSKKMKFKEEQAQQGGQEDEDEQYV